MSRIRLFALLLVLAGMVSCGQPPQWYGTDVGGMLPDLAFELVDSSGAPVGAVDFRGKTTLLFFGFTNCPGPCPATLSRIGLALDELGDTGNEVQVLMVSVDPDRDSPEALQRFEKSFDPWLHGLTGDAGKLAAVKDTYKVYAERLAADNEGNYDVAHGLTVFAFDAQGRCRLLWSDVSDTQAVAGDLERLVGET